MAADPHGLDEFLLPMWEYVAAFGGDLLPEGDMAEVLQVDSMELRMPMEVVVVGDAHVEELLAAPPTLHLTTSFMPAFHGLRIRLEAS